MSHENLAFDTMDPHGSTHAGGHHGHTIVPWQVQLGVLLALLFFTALTVAVSQFEIWASAELGVAIPNWVNVGGAMLIATIKATLVCMFFMQLRYDKALNTVVFASCLFCVFIFVFFSMADLGSRGIINPEKSGEIVRGGTGRGLSFQAAQGAPALQVGPRPDTGGGTIVDLRYEQKRQSFPSDEAFWADYYHHQVEAGNHPHRHERDAENYFARLGYDHSTEISTAWRSRPRMGRTEGLFDAQAPVHTPGLHHEPHGPGATGDHEPTQDHPTEGHPGTEAPGGDATDEATPAEPDDA